MATIPRSYLTTSKTNLSNIPLKNGQVISVYDSDEVWYDVPKNGAASGDPVRRKISGVRVIATLPDPNDPDTSKRPMEGIIYVYIHNSQEDLRIWINNAWVIVGNNTTDTEVTTEVSDSKFYLTGSIYDNTNTGTLVKNTSLYVEDDVLYGDVATAAHADTADTATNASYDDGATPKKISSYINNITGSGSTLTITKGNGTTSTITLPNTTYSVFTASAAGLVNKTSDTVLSDSTNLLLTGSGWMDISNISFPAMSRAIADGAGQTITSTYYKNASISGTTLTLTKGDDTTTTVLTIPDTTYSRFTSSADGLVPAASAAGDASKFLKGDGTWGSVPVNTYQGATASADGVDGVVPHADAGEMDYYLKGDATWGTTFGLNSAGLVPAPTVADTNKFLQVISDGNNGLVGQWSSSLDTKNTAGSSPDVSAVVDHKLYLVGALTQDSSGVQTYTNNKVYIQNDKLYSNNSMVVTDFDISSITDSIYYKADVTLIADVYDATATYAVGDYCMYDENSNGLKLYVCNTAISTAEDPFDPTHWDAVLITELIDNANSASAISYDNTTSGLAATDVQSAIDEVVSDISDRGYSSTERLIGTWIDGNDLFEQTITLSSLTASAATTVAHSITADKIFIKEGFTEYTVSSDDFTGIISAYASSASDEQFCVKIDTTNITYIAGTNLSGATAYITVRYTKPAS